MIVLWFLVWWFNSFPHVEWFGPVWNSWGISLLISICLL